MKGTKAIERAERHRGTAEPPRMGNDSWERLVEQVRSWLRFELGCGYRLEIIEELGSQSAAIYVHQATTFWVMDGEVAVRGEVRHEIDIDAPLMPQAKRIAALAHDIEKASSREYYIREARREVQA